VKFQNQQRWFCSVRASSVLPQRLVSVAPSSNRSFPPGRQIKRRSGGCLPSFPFQIHSSLAAARRQSVLNYLSLGIVTIGGHTNARRLRRARCWSGRQYAHDEFFSHRENFSLSSPAMACRKSLLSKTDSQCPHTKVRAVTLFPVSSLHAQTSACAEQRGQMPPALLVFMRR